MRVYLKAYHEHHYYFYYIFLDKMVLRFIRTDIQNENFKNVFISTNIMSRPVMDKSCKEIPINTLSQDFYNMVVKHLFKYNIRID